MGAVAKTRDKVIHFYFGVDLDTIWEMIVQDIPNLKQRLADVIRVEGWEDEV